MSKTRLFMIIAIILLSLTLTWTVLAANSAQGTLLAGKSGQHESTAKMVGASAESAGIEAVASQYSFSSSGGTYTEIISGTVHGNASNDDTSFNAIDLGFTFHFNNVDYTQVSIQSNGFVAMGASVSSSYTPLSTGTSNNVIVALGRDIEGNDTTSTLTSKMEGAAPNRVFTVQWSHYKRYGTAYVGDDFNFQIKLYETSGLVEVVYGPFTAVYNASPPTIQVGLRGTTNADFNNRTTSTDWTATTAGTTNTDALVLTDLIFPPTGLTFDWTPVIGAFLTPETQSGQICKGSDVVYNLNLVNATGMATSFDLAYTSIWPYVGPMTSPVIPDGGTWDFQVTVHVPWSANAGDIDTLTVTATGGGYTDNAQLITAASNFSNWVDYSDNPRPVRSPSIVYKDGKLYKIGGYDGAARAYVDIYDIATDTWTQGADMPGPRYWLDCEAIGDGIFCAGGYSTAGQTTLYRYDVLTDTWSTLAPMSAYRYSYASVVMNSKYYVIGGYGAGYPATIWEYDPAIDTWNYGLPNMAAGRRYHSAGVIGGKIYVAGGYNPSYLSSVEIFDPVANTWSAGPSMPTSWLGAADGVFADRYLVLAGGDDNSTAAASNLVWILDAVTGTWSAGPNLVHAVYGAEGVGDGTGVWVVTGRLYDGAYSYSQYTSKLGQCDTTCTPVSGLDFSWEPLVPWTNFPVSFDASFAAGSPAITFDWTFGDGGTGQGELTEHTYLLANTYSVGLTATNCDGASTATATHNVTVILPPTISVNPTSLSSTQYPDTLVTQTLEICNVGDDTLSWEINETDGTIVDGGLTTSASNASEIPEDIIRLEDDSVDCAAYENYTGYEPAEVAAACPVTLPPGVASNLQAPTDIGYALDIGYVSDNFVSFTLNNFAGQTVVAQNAIPFYGMDFDPSAGVLYALNDTSDELGTIDLTTGAFTGLVAAPPGGGAANWTGLSIDPVTGVFYASTATDLYTLDPGTGVSTLVGTFGTTLMIDIAVNMNGEMYGHDIGTDSIYSINTTTGVATLIGLTGFNANYAQGLDFDNDDGTLYIFLYIGSGANLYGTVNLTTGAVTQISNTPQGEFEGAVQIPGTPFDLPWLSETPITGTLPGGICQNVDVTFDSTGLAVGQYLGGLDVNSNDPVNPTVPVPVTLDVISQFFPDIEVTPAQLSETLFPDEQATQQLNVCNVGDAPLDWTLAEVPGMKVTSVTPDRAPSSEIPNQIELNFEANGISGYTAPAPIAPEDSVSLVLDDGTRENDIGIGGTLEMLWVNRFTPDPIYYPFQLTEVQIYFSNVGLVNVGDDIVLVFYENTTGNNDPAVGSNFLASFPTTVQALNAWNVYTLPSPVVFNGPGDAIVGVIGMEVPGTSYWPASMDQTATQARSWAGWWNSSPPPNPPILPPPNWTLIDAYFPGNWMVRGYGETLEADVIPWLSENPTSGTVLPSACTVIDVTFDSTGLTPDTYTGALLVNSNDPDEPTVTVPVTLVVEANVPDIVVTAPPLEMTLVLGTSGTLDMSIGNIGNADLVWSMADGVTWLSEAPDAGTTLPGDTTTVVVTFNSAGLAPGEHLTNLVITSNDPDEPSVSLPVTLTVVAPDIDVTAPPLVMTLYPNQTGSLTFTIANLGTSDLTWNLVDDAAWLSEAPITGTILPSGSTVVTVTFDSAGLTPGTYTATITITSDDPDEPSVTLDVTLTVINYGFFLPIVQR